MEDKRDIETQLLLTVHKSEEWDEVVYDRFRRIFWANQVESCDTKIKTDFELVQSVSVWYEPAIRSGNSFLRAKQSSVNQLSSSGVMTLMVV